jgi:hypothetical protein
MEDHVLRPNRSSVSHFWVLASDLILFYVRNALMLQLTECEYMNVVFDMVGIRKDTTYTYTWQCVQLINAFHTILGSTVNLEWMPDWGMLLVICQYSRMRNVTKNPSSTDPCLILISHQPAVFFSQNKPATSNQPTVLFSQNKSAPTISHQPNEQAEILTFSLLEILAFPSLTLHHITINTPKDIYSEY